MSTILDAIAMVATMEVMAAVLASAVYGMVIGARGRLRGLNIVGMKRSGVSRPDIHALRNAYRLIFDPAAPVADNIVAVREKYAGSASVTDVLDFMTERGKRHFVVPPLGGKLADADDEAE